MNRVYPFRTLRIARQGSIRLTQRRAWYDGEGEDAPTPDQPDTPPDKGGQSDQEGGATFTQAQINAMIEDRLKRDREAQRKKLFEDLGVQDEATLKAQIQAQRKADEANKTELEKAQQAIADLEKKAQDALTRAEQAEQAAKEERRNTAILNALKDAQAEHPGDMLIWLAANKGDAIAATLTEEGQPDAKAIEALVADAKKERPSYFKTGGPGSPSNSGGKIPMPDNKELRKEIRKTIRY